MIVQIDEDSFYLIEQGPQCRYIQLQRCEVLQGRCGGGEGALHMAALPPLGSRVGCTAGVM